MAKPPKKKKKADKPAMGGFGVKVPMSNMNSAKNC